MQCSWSDAGSNLSILGLEQECSVVICSLKKVDNHCALLTFWLRLCLNLSFCARSDFAGCVIGSESQCREWASRSGSQGKQLQVGSATPFIREQRVHVVISFIIV